MNKLSVQDVRCPTCKHGRGWLGSTSKTCQKPLVGKYPGVHLCGCKCEFPSPSVSEAAPEYSLEQLRVFTDRVHQPPEQNSEGKLAFELSWKDIQSFEHVQAALAELEKIDTAHVASNGLSTEATAISAARVLLDGYFQLQESKIKLREQFQLPVTEQNSEDKNSVLGASDYSQTAITQDISLDAALVKLCDEIDARKRLFYCNKCGYFGETSWHAGCNYGACQPTESHQLDQVSAALRQRITSLQPEDDHQTTTEESPSPASFTESEFESASVHQPDVQAADAMLRTQVIDAAIYLEKMAINDPALHRQAGYIAFALRECLATSPVQPEVSKEQDNAKS